jgi:hypothetical protein
MEVEYIYDSETKARIDKFKGYLAQYEAMLMDRLNNHTEFGHMGLLDLHRTKREAFLSDPQRLDLEKQLAKVYALAIPEKVMFSDTANACNA